MPHIAYKDITFKRSTQIVINQANEIIDDYQGQGFKLTLRQLYYQFVARDLIPNTMQSYQRLGSIINDARLSGEIDWEAIEDRTRNLEQKTRWDDPEEIIRNSALAYHRDMWDGQDNRVEVWIEKEALIGVVEDVCRRYDVPYFACRGYTSQSEQWAAGQRFKSTIENGQMPVVLHLGDHDPSGIDMTRDNTERLCMFAEGEVIVERLALNMDQVRRYRPPPNPAKMTDSRFNGYVERFGEKCWELDALSPTVIARLIEDNIQAHITDHDLWLERKASIERERGLLERASERWADVVKFLSKGKRR
jgi:hypothetical protein